MSGPQMPSEHSSMEVLLFGDLSLVQFEPQLRHILHVKTNPLLRSFFDRVNYALRRQVEVLPISQQRLFPHFTTLIDLFSRLGETEGTPVLRFFLLSVCQLAHCIIHYSEGMQSFPSRKSTYVLGLCTGGFAAAAVSCAESATSLVPLAVEAALCAFRTALCSYMVGATLTVAGSPSGVTKSWSATVNSAPGGGGDAETLLGEYNVSQARTQLWISATSPSKATTVSGHPSALQSFLSAHSTELKSRSLNVESPYHAAHLFDESKAAHIAAETRRCHASVASLVPRITCLLPSTGEPVNATDFAGLLQAAADETLRIPIRWEAVLTSCRQEFSNRGAKGTIVAFYASYVASMMASALEKDTPGAQLAVEDVTGSVAGTANTSTPSQMPQPTGRFDDSRIAIVGYSGRFPSAASNELFWELLMAGRDVHREIPTDRFDWKAHYDASGQAKNTSRVKYGCFIDEPGVFDSRFFNMSPREAENTDPAQRLAITSAYEAMEMAGMVRNRTPSTQQDRIGVFFGTTSDDWREVNSGQDVGTYFIPGGNRAFIPGRISYFFRFSGPSLSFDTACSSSFAAIQAACSYLWRGECDTAIAGGTNVLTNPDNFAGLDRGHFLSTTGNCNAFDDGANGYCRADAVGAVVLKRLEDAEADNDPIFGVIVGSNTNHCGHTESITRPHEGDQVSVFRRILRYADTNPLDVSYVEMHGTGTQAGDATEMNSVLSVFVPDCDRTASLPERPLFLGSAKANIGHAESASGVSSLVKVLQMMKHSTIPPHCGIKTRINHRYPLDLAERGVHIALRPTPWVRPQGGKRAAFLNNFSAAGGNTAILLEDAPPARLVEGHDPRPRHIITITAQSPRALSDNLAAMIAFLEANPSVSLPALSYTTTARRMHHSYRVAVSGTNVASILSALHTRAADMQAKEPKPIARAPLKKTRVVFAFAGQGTLYVELGRTLFDVNPDFRVAIEGMHRLAVGQGFEPFLGLIDGTITDLAQVGPVMSQLALTCVQLALCDLWRAWGVQPAAVVGHSLGEYAMLREAGVLSTADILYLVGTRGRLLQDRCAPDTHTMLVVTGSMDVAGQLLRVPEAESRCELACVNSPTSHVLAGPTECIEALAVTAAAMGVETARLSIPFAFHSAQVEPILDDFAQAAGSRSIVHHPPTIPVLSPLLSRVVPASEADTLNDRYLINACRSTVNFQGALDAGAQHSSLAIGDSARTVWLDIGAHPVCGGMIKGTLGGGSITTASLRKGVDAYTTLTATLETLYTAGVEIDWGEYHRSFPAAHRVLELPAYRWDLKNYWIPYRNNFTLAKGEGLVPALEHNGRAALADVEVAKPAAKYLSPSAQEVLHEEHGPDTSSLVVESDIFDSRLLHILQGHLVNGAALCPSSLYVDLALTMAHYLIAHSPNGLHSASSGLDVADVQVDNSIIARPGLTTFRYRATATADWSAAAISLSITSAPANNPSSSRARPASYATLSVLLHPRQRWLTEWRRQAHLITSRVDALVASPEAHMLRRGMAYKLFASLVTYGPEYQAMREVVLHSARLEATSTVEFPVGDQGFTTGINPKWVDGLGHIAGFIMNASDAVDNKSMAFINHGWERMRIAEMPSPGKTYRVYNRMQLVDKTLYAGDTYVLDQDRIIAIFEGVTFQGVPRRVLDHLLPSQAGPGKRPGTAAAASANVPPPRAAPPKLSPQPNSSVAQQEVDAATKKPPRDVFVDIMKLISQEAGVTVNELGPDVELAALGIDSLMSLTITSRIRDEIGLDLPSSLFLDASTVSEVATLVGGGSGGEEASHGSTTSVTNTSDSDDGVSQGFNNETPASDVLSVNSNVRAAQVLRQVLAEESSMPIEELTPSTGLADIGVDSLMGLTIGAKLQELLEVDLPGNTLLECETLQDAEDVVCRLLGFDNVHASVAATNSALSSVVMSSGDTIVSNKTIHDISLPQASSVLLSGSSVTAQTLLFLFPDGSGSATSYAALARAIDPSRVAVYGLNCPWRKNGAEMTRLGLNMATMVSRYVAEVISVLTTSHNAFKQQGRNVPSFALGGWSAGGILAVEAARQLAEQQQQHPGVSLRASHVVLYDAPNPIGLQNPPARMYDFFDTLGIFGGVKGKPPPGWLREHFDAFLRVLDAYEPVPLPEPAPPSIIMYARDGVCKDPGGPRMEVYEDDPREMIWLLNNRTDFEATGWKSVLGKGLKVAVLDDINHFTLVEDRTAIQRMGVLVGDFLANA